MVELQRCLGSEESQINAAMKTLLEGDFVIGKKVLHKPPPPPYTNEPKMSNEPYDGTLLVRSMEYNGRFYNHESPENIHLLWAFTPGTRIANRLSAEEKKTVVAFARAAEKRAEQSSSKDKDSRK